MLCDSAEPRCSGTLTDECEKYPNCSGSPKEALGSNGLRASFFLEILYSGGNVAATVILACASSTGGGPGRSGHKRY